MWHLIPLPYRAGLVVIVLAVLVGIGYRQGLVHERNTKVAEIAKLNQAFSERIATAQAAKDAAEAKATQTEHEAATALSVADTKHSKELTDANEKTAVAVAAYRAGTSRLRVDVATNTGSSRAVGSPAAATSGSDGATVAYLSDAVAGNLVSLAGEADAVVLQLGFAQDTIKAYYKACGPQ